VVRHVSIGKGRAQAVPFAKEKEKGVVFCLPFAPGRPSRKKRSELPIEGRRKKKTGCFLRRSPGGRKWCFEPCVDGCMTVKKSALAEKKKGERNGILPFATGLGRKKIRSEQNRP